MAISPALDVRRTNFRLPPMSFYLVPTKPSLGCLCMSEDVAPRLPHVSLVLKILGQTGSHRHAGKVKTFRISPACACRSESECTLSAEAGEWAQV